MNIDTILPPSQSNPMIQVIGILVSLATFPWHPLSPNSGGNFSMRMAARVTLQNAAGGKSRLFCFCKVAPCKFVGYGNQAFLAATQR